MTTLHPAMQDGALLTFSNKPLQNRAGFFEV